MSGWLRAPLVFLSAVGMALTLSALPLPADAAEQAPAVRAISYHGLRVEVPTSWPVIDLAAAPRTCIRLDRHAVYLGAPGQQQDCPAHVVGRADTIWLRPSAGVQRPLMHSRPSKVGDLPAVVGTDTGGHVKQAVFPDQGVELEASWASDPTTVDHVLASASADHTSPAGPAPSVGQPSAPPAPRSAPSATPSTATPFTGMGFDTCAAPSTSVMNAWLASPYRSAGIYLGGSMRACPDGNLSAAWVGAVQSMGYGLIPIYVGPQAPCVLQTNLAHIDPAQAAAQGKANADDAVSRAQFFGLGSGTPIYYDLESYDPNDPGCTAAVLSFVTAWTTELHRLGYTAGVYGDCPSLMVDLSNAVGSSGSVPPDDVWFAAWNGLQTTSDSAVQPEFPDRYWSHHQRLHQYNTATQSWGGVALNIDANWVDGALAGHAVPVSYGTGTYGPGGTSFVFTGKMNYWRPNASHGRKGMAYWTYPSGTGSEQNGATWAPSLGAGLYRVSANIPKTNATAKAHYTVTDAKGATSTVINQRAVTADGAAHYAPLGTYLFQSGRPIRVHVSDDGAGPTTDRIGVDAVSFQLVATAPAAPTSVSAIGGSGGATVRWAAAGANGSAISGYTVTASPGGAAVVVGGSATSAVVTGLTKGTAYTFTVRARNAVGVGPASPPSNAVTPSTSVGGLTAVHPVRLLDTRVGTRSNPVRTALGAGKSVTVAVAGVTGSPVPAGASAVALNVTVIGPKSNGYLFVGDVAAAGTSMLNYYRGQMLANLVVSKLSAQGTVTIVNHSAGSVQVLADVEGYVTPSTSVGGLTAVHPVRLLDTRVGTRSNPVRTALGAGKSVTVAVAGVTGSPVPAGASAVALNVTVIGPKSNGYLFVGDVAAAGTSMLNYYRGQMLANLVVSKLSAQGTVTIVNHSAGSVQVLADVEGYVS